MDKIKVIERYADRKAEAHELAASSNKAARARLVWFVAIAGYAFLNFPIYLKALMDEPVSGVALIVITIPWAIAALLGVITHWLIGELVALDDQYYADLMGVLQMSVVTLGDEITDQQFRDLMGEKDEGVTTRREKVAQLFPWVTRMERLTFFFLCFAFLWSVTYALILIKV